MEASLVYHQNSRFLTEGFQSYFRGQGRKAGPSYFVESILALEFEFDRILKRSMAKFHSSLNHLLGFSFVIQYCCHLASSQFIEASFDSNYSAIDLAIRFILVDVIIAY